MAAAGDEEASNQPGEEAAPLYEKTDVVVMPAPKEDDGAASSPQKEERKDTEAVGVDAADGAEAVPSSSLGPPEEQADKDEGRKERRSEDAREERDRKEGMRAGKKSLLVRNLSYGTTKYDLREAFEKHGSIRDVYIPLDYKTKEPRGFAFVEFEESEGAAVAVQAMDREVIEGREIRVVYAQQQRKNPEEMRSIERRHGGGRDYDRRGRGGGGGRYDDSDYDDNYHRRRRRDDDYDYRRNRDDSYSGGSGSKRRRSRSPLRSRERSRKRDDEDDDDDGARRRSRRSDDDYDSRR